MEEVKTRASVRENFDIGKITNAGFKLDYVVPMKQGETTVCEIGTEHISPKIAYWRNVVVCYILGTYPPFSAMNGYI